MCRQELAWVGEESNEFGTDEFLQWCEAVGTEPFFALNFGTGKSWVHFLGLLLTCAEHLDIGTLDEGKIASGTIRERNQA